MSVEGKVLEMSNAGSSLRAIAEELGISKNKVARILDKILKPESAVNKSREIEIEKVLPVVADNSLERVSSFSGWDRIGVNEYSHKETGEIMTVKFVKGTEDNNFTGFFVKQG